MVVEHKSRGQDLDRAFVQALDYFPGIADRDLPKYVLVSDFGRFRLYDLDTGSHSEFALKDLHKHIKRFGFIAGYAPQEIKPQDPVNIKAAEQMGRLPFRALPEIHKLSARRFEAQERTPCAQVKIEKALEISLIRISGTPLADVTKNVFNECVALHS